MLVMAIGIWGFASLNPNQVGTQSPSEPSPETPTPADAETQADAEANPYYYDYDISFGRRPGLYHGVWYDSSDSWEGAYEMGVRALVEMGEDDVRAHQIADQAYNNILLEDYTDHLAWNGHQAFVNDGHVFYLCFWARGLPDVPKDYMVLIKYEPFQTFKDVKANIGPTPSNERN